MEETPPDLLQEIETDLNMQPASTGLRFANYLIDIVCYYVILFSGALLYGMLTYDVSETYYNTTESTGSDFYYLLLAIITLTAYYTLFEFFSKGRTFGKMITGTLAVREDGSSLTFKDAFVRSICRFIPFEPFSAFGGYPWHDNFSNTVVIKKPKKF